MLIEAIPQTLVGSSRFRASYNVVQINRQVYSILDTDLIVDAEVRNRNPVSQGTIISRATMVTTPSVILGPRVNYVYAYSTLSSRFNWTLKECHTQLVYQIRRMSTIYPEGHDIRFEISDGFVYNSNIACFSKPQVVYRFRVPYYGEMTVDSPLDMEFLYTRIRNPGLLEQISQFEPMFCRAVKNATFVTIHFPWSDFIGFRPLVNKKFTSTISSLTLVDPRGIIVRLGKSNQQAQSNFEIISTTYPNLYWKGTKRGFRSNMAAAFSTSIKLPAIVPAYGTWTTSASNLYNNTRRRSFASTIDRVQSSVNQTPTRIRFSKSTQSSAASSYFDFSNTKSNKNFNSTMSSSSSIAAKLSSRPYLDYDTYQATIPNVSKTMPTFVTDTEGIAAVLLSTPGTYTGQTVNVRWHMFDPNTLAFTRELVAPAGYWSGNFLFGRVNRSRTSGYSAGANANYIAIRHRYQNSTAPHIVIWDRTDYSTRVLSPSLTNQILHSVFIGTQGLALLKAGLNGVHPYTLEIYNLSDLSLVSSTTFPWTFDVLTEVIETNLKGQFYIPGRHLIDNGNTTQLDPVTGYRKSDQVIIYDLNNMTTSTRYFHSLVYTCYLGSNEIISATGTVNTPTYYKMNLDGTNIQTITGINYPMYGITDNYIFTRQDTSYPNYQQTIVVWDKNTFSRVQNIQVGNQVGTLWYPIIQGQDEYILKVDSNLVNSGEMYKNDGN